MSEQDCKAAKTGKKIKFIILIFFLWANAGMSAQTNEAKFKIYCFAGGAVDEKFDLSMYSYDKNWLDFLNNVNPYDAFMLITDNDVEEYYWAGQLIKLNKTGCGKLNNIKYLSHTKFIVTLNEERLYAGRFIPVYSAMALKHPVIYFNVGKYYNLSGCYMQMQPTHFLGERDIVEDLIKITGVKNINKIKDYFTTINKLK